MLFLINRHVPDKKNYHRDFGSEKQNRQTIDSNQMQVISYSRRAAVYSDLF